MALADLVVPNWVLFSLGGIIIGYAWRSIVQSIKDYKLEQYVKSIEEGEQPSGDSDSSTSD